MFISISTPYAHSIQNPRDTYGDLDAVIGEDEGGVRAGELGSRHGVGGRGSLARDCRKGLGEDGMK